MMRMKSHMENAARGTSSALLVLTAMLALFAIVLAAPNTAFAEQPDGADGLVLASETPRDEGAVLEEAEIEDEEKPELGNADAVSALVTREDLREEEQEPNAEPAVSESQESALSPAGTEVLTTQDITIATLTMDVYGNYGVGFAYEDFDYVKVKGDEIYDYSLPVAQVTRSEAAVSEFYVNAGNLTRVGYRFDGWNTARDGSGEPVTNESKYSDFDSSLVENTLYAQWILKTYSITYVSDNPDWQATVERDWATKYDYMAYPGETLPETGKKLVCWNVTLPTPTGSNIVNIVVDHNLKSLAEVLLNENYGEELKITFSATWGEISYSYQDVLVGDKESVQSFVGITGVTAGQTIVFENDKALHYGTPNEGLHSYQGYVFDAASMAQPQNASIIISDSHVNVFKVYYKAKTYTVEYFWDNKYEANEAKKHVSFGKPVSGIAYDSTDFDKVEKLPAGYDRIIRWYYIDQDGNKCNVTASTALYTIMGTNPGRFEGENAESIKLYAELDPIKVEYKFGALVSDGGTVEKRSDGTLTDPLEAPDPSDSKVPTGLAKANPGYKFVGWDYTIDMDWSADNDSDGSQLTPVTADIATLSTSEGGAEYYSVKPRRLAASETDSTPIWKSLYFVARFASSTDPTVTIHHHFEDPNGKAQSGFTHAWKDDTATTVTTVVADGAEYTARAWDLTQVGYEGYSETEINEANEKTNKTHQVDSNDPSTLVFDIYYLANTYDVSFVYSNTQPVEGNTTPAWRYNNSYKFGKKVTLPAAPLDSAGDYRFVKWACFDWAGDDSPLTIETDAATGKQFFLMPVPVGTGDTRTLTMTGLWERITCHVTFVSADADKPVKGKVPMKEADGYDPGIHSTLSNYYGIGGIEGFVTVQAAKDGTFEKYYISGWKMKPKDEGEQTLSGISAPLSQQILKDTVFTAIWSPNYVYTYSNDEQHKHGKFETQTYFRAIANTQDDDYGFRNTVTSDPGWVLAGWGWMVDNVWQYSTVYNNAIDYLGVTSEYTVSDLPRIDPKATEYVRHDLYAVYKALPRKVVYSNIMFDDLDKSDPGTWNDAVTEDKKEPKQLTGREITLLQYLDDNTTLVMTRPGYVLAGWTVDGTETFGLGAAFEVPESANEIAATLHPVWNLVPIEVDYRVDTAGWGVDEIWGTVSPKHEEVKNVGDSIKGSTPTANPGYSFACWTKDSDPTTPINDETYNATTHVLTPIASGTYWAHFVKNPVITYRIQSTARASWTSGGNSDETDNTHAVGSSNIALLGVNTVYLAGKKLDGWSKDQGAPLGLFTLESLTGDVTLFPVWKDRVYTLHYVDPVGNTGATAELEISKQENLTWSSEFSLPPIGSSATNHTIGWSFIGWGAVANASLDQISGAGTNSSLSSLFGPAYENKDNDYDRDHATTSLKLYAQWTENAFTVTYALNYSSLGRADLLPKDYATLKPQDHQKVLWTSTDLEPENELDASMIPRGYVFAGWYYKDNQNVVHKVEVGKTDYRALSNALNTSAATDSIELAASWAEDKVNLSFSAKSNTAAAGGTISRYGETVGAVTGAGAAGSGVVVNDDGTISVASATATPGYSFVKWQLAGASALETASLTAQAEDDATNTIVDETNPVLTLAAGSDGLFHTASYEALFAQNELATLMYDANGGEGSIASVSDGIGTIVTLSNGSGFTRKGYTITGWNIASDGSGTAYGFGDNFTLATGTTTLYAQWSKDAEQEQQQDPNNQSENNTDPKDEAGTNPKDDSNKTVDANAGVDEKASSGDSAADAKPLASYAETSALEPLRASAIDALGDKPSKAAEAVQTGDRSLYGLVLMWLGITSIACTLAVAFARRRGVRS